MNFTSFLNEEYEEPRYGNNAGYGSFFFNLDQQRSKKKFEASIKSVCDIDASTDSVCEFSFRFANDTFIKILKKKQDELNNGSYLKYK